MTSKLREFDAAYGQAPRAATALLHGWLTDDGERAALYEEMRCSRRTVLTFTSTEGLATGSPPKEVHLLVDRDDIETALKHFKVTPYAALGGGRFLLAIDNPRSHDAQREFVAQHLRYEAPIIAACAEEAFRRASILPLKQPRFDLPALAEQAALRFLEQLFGLPEEDFVALGMTMQRAYLELSFRIIGRHFDDELEPRPPLPKDFDDLDTRLRRLFEHPPKEFAPTRWSRQHLAGQTVVERCRAFDNGHGAEMLAVILVGLGTGTVGNVQAAVTIALDHLFNAPAGAIAAATRAARAGRDDELWPLICEALVRNPPAAFLARAADGEHAVSGPGGQPLTLPAGAEVLLGIGGAQSSELVFGGATADRGYVHQCVGEHLARPLVTCVVREVLRLPGLAQAIDGDKGAPRRPAKRWGVVCSDYPLSYASRRRLAKSPLMVVMRIKPPLEKNAGRILRLIAAGAPTIEDALRDSGHVHAAWFGLVSGGTELALYTVYDGDFDAYIEHFALKVELFDKLFEFIDDPPPMPVRDHPKEFVEKIRQYNRAPVGNFFFSAYPPVTVADIRNHVPPWEAP
jgi:cytochrome P450